MRNPFKRPTPPTGKPRMLRGGSWNLKEGRAGHGKPLFEQVLAEVVQLLRSNNLDFLAVIEAERYIRYLKAHLPEHGYRVHWSEQTDGSARDSAVIVRKGLEVTNPRLHRLETEGWERRPGRPGLHWPRSMFACNVGWLRVFAVHMPPGPFGPDYPLRRRANLVSFSNLQNILLWNKYVPYVAPGDYNRTRKDPVMQQFQRIIGAVRRGRHIDHVFGRSVRIKNFRRGDKAGSDHYPILFDAYERR